MSTDKKYVYLITMPSQFEYEDPWGFEGYTLDHVNNYNGENETKMRNSFWGFYGDIGWGEEDDRYRRIPKIKSLIRTFGYSLTHTRENYVDGQNVVIKLTILTNALGTHLTTILDIIDKSFDKDEEGCRRFIRAAKMVRHGWQNLNPTELIDCEHTRSRLLQVMNDKDGSIVQVRCCSKCKEVFKKPVR